MPAPYAFDPTGIASANLVTGETHVLTAMNFQDYYFIVPTYGPFFEDGLVVSHTALDSTVTTLDLGTDYYLTHWFIGASRACANPIYGSITFLDLEIAGTVTIAYQTLGGNWVIDNAKITEILGDRLHNPRVTAWEQVSGYPTVFPVIDHEWNLTDMVGMADIIPHLDDIQDAILTRAETGLAAHEAAVNPHGITPALIGTMTTAEINTLFGTVDAVTPSVLASAISTAMAAHLAAADPHPQYDTDAEVVALTGAVTTTGAVRKPLVLSPGASEVLTASAFSIQGDPYYSLYGVPQGGSEFQIAASSSFSSVLYDAVRGAVQLHTVPAGAVTAGGAYYARLRYQNTDGIWSLWSDPVAFTTGTATVATPTFSVPTSGATGVDVTATLTASAFAMTSGSDTQDSTDWEVWTGPGGTGTRAFESSLDSVNLTTITLGEGSLAPSTLYYARVRYRSTGSGASAWSADRSFTTTTTVIVSASIGDSFAGGFLAGYFNDSGTRYALVVSPRAQGEINLDTYPFSTKAFDISGAHSLINGKTNTQLMADHSSGYFKAAKRARALNIAGFTDWYIPSRDEAELLFRNFKASTRLNETGSRTGPGDQGENANSDPTGSTYTTTVPGQTSVVAFRTTGTEVISQDRKMATSTMDGSFGLIWSQLWSNTVGSSSNNGNQNTNGNNNPTNSSWVCRAVRRVPAP